MICRGIQEPWGFQIDDNFDCGVAPDLAIMGGDLAAGNVIRNAIMIQLMSRKGWWGDLFSTIHIGSDLSKIEGRSGGDDDILDAQMYVFEALQPLIDQGLFADAVVTAYRRDGRLSIDLKITGNDSEIYQQKITSGFSP